MAKGRGSEQPGQDPRETHRQRSIDHFVRDFERERVERELPHLVPGAPAQEPDPAVVAELGNLPALRRAARVEGQRRSRHSKAGSVIWRVGAVFGLIDATFTGAAAAADWDDGVIAGTVGGAVATTTIVGGVVKFFTNRAKSDDSFRRAREYGDMIEPILGGEPRSRVIEKRLRISGDSTDAVIAARVAEVAEVIKRRTKERGAHRLPLRQGKARRGR